jgi:hypothetical protein
MTWTSNLRFTSDCIVQAWSFVSVLLLSCRLQRLHVLQLRAPYVVPEFTRDTKAVDVSNVGLIIEGSVGLPKLEVLVVMCQVIFLQLPDVLGQVLVVKEVMRAIIANVSEDPTAEDGHCSIPVVEEHSMR